MKLRDEEWLLEKKLVLEEYDRENRKAERGKILFAGSSLMYNFPIERYAAGMGLKVYNRGVCGFEIDEYIDVINTVILDLKPSVMYINIGSNDLGNPEYTMDQVIEKYERLAALAEEELPEIEIVFMAYYPVNPDTEEELMKEQLEFRTNELIGAANEKIRELARKLGQRYLDVNKGITDEEGCLKKIYSIDGVHITEEGYGVIFEDLSKDLKRYCKR